MNCPTCNGTGKQEVEVVSFEAMMNGKVEVANAGIHRRTPVMLLTESIQTAKRRV